MTEQRYHFDILDSSQWERLKNIRLEALRDSPQAMSASLAEEERLSPEQWQAMLTHAHEHWILARDTRTNEDVGLMMIRATDEALRWASADADCWMQSCWLHPAHRGGHREGEGEEKGETHTPADLLSLLLGFVDELCRQRQWRKQGLGVYVENTRAVRAYEKRGFAVQGEPIESRKQPGRLFVALFRCVH